MVLHHRRGRGRPRQVLHLIGRHGQDNRALVELRNLVCIDEAVPARSEMDVDDESIEDISVCVGQDVFDLAHTRTVGTQDVRASFEREVRDPLPVVHAASIAGAGYFTSRVRSSCWISGLRSTTFFLRSCTQASKRVPASERCPTSAIPGTPYRCVICT